MYKIIITETIIEEKLKGKEWEILKSVKDGDSVYGYTPEITKKIEIETVILEQNIKELDLKAVIKAINKL